jgi:hypothetical protein
MHIAVINAQLYIVIIKYEGSSNHTAHMSVYARSVYVLRESFHYRMLCILLSCVVY